MFYPSTSFLTFYLLKIRKILCSLTGKERLQLTFSQE